MIEGQEQVVSIPIDIGTLELMPRSGEGRVEPQAGHGSGMAWTRRTPASPRPSAAAFGGASSQWEFTSAMRADPCLLIERRPLFVQLFEPCVRHHLRATEHAHSMAAIEDGEAA